MRDLNEIIVHCTATRVDWMTDASCKDKVAEIRRWHKGNGWKDIGYHFVIDRDGIIELGRPLEQTGAHVKGHNTGTIGIALVGGHGSSETDKPLDNFTLVQLRALREKLKQLMETYPSITKVTGHNDYANKACPGFDAKRWWKYESPARTSLLESKTVQATSAGAVATATGAVTAVGALDGTAQIVALVCTTVVALAFLVIFRERVKKWVRGDR